MDYSSDRSRPCLSCHALFPSKGSPNACHPRFSGKYLRSAELAVGRFLTEPSVEAWKFLHGRFIFIPHTFLLPVGTLRVLQGYWYYGYI